jgi:hypothetical protein
VWGRGKLIDSPDILIDQTTRGRALKIKAAPETPPNQIKQCYLIVAVGAEHMTCRTWNGTTMGSNDIKIAKPPEFRESYAEETLPSGVTIVYSAWNWTDQTRTATPDDSTPAETQVIVPRYLISAMSDDEVPIVLDNSMIWADRVNWSGADDGAGADVKLIDINISGRYWCKIDET